MARTTSRRLLTPICAIFAFISIIFLLSHLQIREIHSKIVQLQSNDHSKNMNQPASQKVEDSTPNNFIPSNETKKKTPDCEEELSKVEQKLQSILESPKVESTACQDCPKCPNCPNCPNCPQCPSHPPCPDSNAIQQTNRPWLIIGIPTIPRQQSYLTRTLKTIDRELEVMNSVLSGKVKVFVMNMKPNEHTEFDALRTQYSSNPKFEFLDSPGDFEDPFPGKMDAGNANLPGFKVRRQSRDIANLLEVVADKSEYYLFYEDDFLFCPHALFAIQYLVRRADFYFSNWIAIRLSFGMNGILLHGKDVAEFSSYLRKHQARRPPDHLIVEWYAGETPESRAYRNDRVNIGFKYNLFEHIGKVSSLRNSHSPSYPRCFAHLLVPTVFETEAYLPKICPHDDMTPCPEPKDSKRLPPISFDHLQQAIPENFDLM